MPTRSRRAQTAFSLVELLVVLVIMGTLAAIAIPSYRQYLLENEYALAERDIAEMSMAIERFHTESGTYPATLAALPAGLATTDPWGNDYQYLAIEATPAPAPGKIRRDKNMNPLNSDYDLYSMGPDGDTQTQLTAAKARDDVVRAGNGGFIGMASEH